MADLAAPPDLDGHAQVRGQATAIIALTASVFDEEKSLVLSAGCDDFIRKPFQPAVIVDKLGQHLGVEFTYAPSATKAAVDLPGAVDLPQGSLGEMPSAWRDRVYQAATQADQQTLLRLIESIPPAQAAVRQTLHRWINDFQFDKLMTLTLGDDEHHLQP